ncbi:MAG: hypothetical protein IJK97_07075 [Thermoguttaceae bacterium]|nr:hypothetical protein [Thermoguttaceae bacterium]MBR0191957.1 hypothetical protein [Thermoguttaceae bacterium]
MNSPHTMTPLILTPQEMREASLYLGVHLPRKYQARYKNLRDQKIRDRRENLASENWEARCFPK